MGLDAVVYCDCFERGRLRSLPKPEWNVHVSDEGGRAPRTGSVEEDIAFDQWDFDACEHERGILLHHFIGNMAGVAFLRKILSQYPNALPITLSKILYSGIHAGDFIAADEVALLEPELKALSETHFDDAEAEDWVRDFERKLRELVERALKVGKPISF